MQSRLESLVERIVDLVIGMTISTLLNYYVIRAFNYPMQWDDSFYITVIFTIVSFVRGYIVRRAFNRYTAYKYRNMFTDDFIAEEWDHK